MYSDCKTAIDILRAAEFKTADLLTGLIDKMPVSIHIDIENLIFIIKLQVSDHGSGLAGIEPVPGEVTVQQGDIHCQRKAALADRQSCNGIISCQIKLEAVCSERHFGRQFKSDKQCGIHISP